METKEIQPIHLKDVTTKFKLIITPELLDKIEHVCRQVSTLEWSGVLFYQVDGSFENKDLVLTAVDMLVQDIGSQGATEFDVSADVGYYMVQNDLIGAQMGLIHSHNSMATFFSGTDQATMLKEGSDRNHFLSLIVNNAGVYTAKVSRKIKYKEKLTLAYNYQTYQEGEVTVQGEEVETETIEVEAFPLDIIKEGRSFPELDELLEELLKKKEARVKTIPTYPGYITKREVPAGPANAAQQDFPFTKPSGLISTPGTGSFNKVEEGDEVYFESPSDDFEPLKATVWEKIPYDKVHFSEDVVQDVLCKILKASPLAGIGLNPTKFANNMESLYSRCFPDLKAFDEWAGSYLEYLIWQASDPSVEALGCSIDEEQAILANDLITEIDKLPTNGYLERYRAILEAYIL